MRRRHRQPAAGGGEGAGRPGPPPARCPAAEGGAPQPPGSPRGGGGSPGLGGGGKVSWQSFPSQQFLLCFGIFIFIFATFGTFSFCPAGWLKIASEETGFSGYLGQLKYSGSCQAAYPSLNTKRLSASPCIPRLQSTARLKWSATH